MFRTHTRRRKVKDSLSYGSEIESNGVSAQHPTRIQYSTKAVGLGEVRNT